MYEEPPIEHDAVDAEFRVVGERPSEAEAVARNRGRFWRIVIGVGIAVTIAVARSYTHH